MLLGIVYLPPRAKASDNEVLYKQIQHAIDEYSRDHPERLIWIVGDFNPTTTNISAVHLKRTCAVSQIVKVLKLDTGTLDWCLTNHPKLCPIPIQLPKIGSSDHYCALVPPSALVPRACKRTIVRRDTRNSRLRDFRRWVTMFPWDYFFSLECTKEKFEYFHRTLLDAADKFLPSSIHGNDEPWMNEHVTAEIRKGQKLLAHCGKDSRLFRHSRNMVQRLTTRIKSVFYANKVKSLKNSNVCSWWMSVKKLSGSFASEGIWYNQPIYGTGISSSDQLAAKINQFFVDLTSDFIPLTPSDITRFHGA